MKFSVVIFRIQFVCIFLSFLLTGQDLEAQAIQWSKGVETTPISTNLFGLFFEDINYAADGGLYAELVQNRSFEYSLEDKQGWNPFSFWEYQTPGFAYGRVSVESKDPIHENNPHYIVLTCEHVGIGGVGLKNNGYDHMVVGEDQAYRFILFARNMGESPVRFKVMLQNTKGESLDSLFLQVGSTVWKEYEATLRPSSACDSTSLVVLAVSPGVVALDHISLMPEATFKNRKNGLRADLATKLEDIKPAFIRFPGGCLVHGDGLGNMYRWKNTVGPVTERKAQKNIWGYHQSMGLGYFEYFQFCEDIGAEPLPVLPAAVSCQNSGGTWRIGGTGQQALPMDEMEDYIQEVKDLIEWANGPATSKWGQVRAAAGHPEPFGLKYIGIGNEDRITPQFESRFQMIFKAISASNPEITLVGTSGPFSDGEDFEKGWALADTIRVPIVDEHYYKEPSWFLSNLQRYDSYDRKGPKVYLGEYASWGNKWQNALAEAYYMAGLERNGDLVEMASYAPLLAKKGHTQWRTDMIFFDNQSAILTPNYYIQQLYSLHKGDTYVKGLVTYELGDTSVAASSVYNSESQKLMIKLVNTSQVPKSFRMDLSKLKNYDLNAKVIMMSGSAEDENTFENRNKIVPHESQTEIAKKWDQLVPPMTFIVLEISSKKGKA